MAFNDTLDAIIASINANTATLRSLLNLTQGGTLEPDDSETTPPPGYDEETGVWTLTQDTANGDGIYEGVYRLADANSCAFLEIVSIVTYQAPATGAPAQLRPCATDLDPSPSFDDLLSITALDGVNFSGFVIRSAIAYEIQVRITACIDGQCGDAVVEFVTATSSVTEGTSTHQVTVRLSLTGGETADDITVDVGYSGTASKPADYTTSTTSVTFLAGSVDGAEQTITLNIVDDAVHEVDETIILTLSNVQGDSGTLGDQVIHTVTLHDNEPEYGDWCISLNFLNLSAGSTYWGQQNFRAVWVSGQGWKRVGTNDHVAIQIPNLGGRVIVRAEITFSSVGNTIALASSYVAAANFSGGSSTALPSDTPPITSPSVWTFSPGTAMGCLMFYFQGAANNGAVITSVKIWGNGTNPLPAFAC